MNSDRHRRIDRDTAERLLQGVPAAWRRGGPLVDQLAAAAAPARPDELVGEAAALAAFQVGVHLGPVTRSGRTSMIKTWLAKLLTVKAAALLVAGTAGGVALAATTGTLPNPLSDRPAATRGVGHADGKLGDDRRGADPSHTPKAGGNGTPSPSLVGLCHAFTAGAGSDHGKALESPAFTVLITTAGGKDKVPTFCAALLAEKPGESPSAEPPHPTAEPTTGPGKSDKHPHPTGPPASHPGH